MRQFALPDLGEGLEEAEIVGWHVTEGDHVVADQPLVSVETDKAVVEVPSPQSGRIVRLYGEKGDIVKVGAPLVEFAEEAEQDTGTVVGKLDHAQAGPAGSTSAREAAPGRPVRLSPAVRTLAHKLGIDLNAVQATGPHGTVTRADVERVAISLADAGPPNRFVACAARWRNACPPRTQPSLRRP
jgi:2-oxoisovalerate dehydrogenase E2 component (dihydrolipoyl transacylase)